jgi:hypothetical protein
VIILLEGVCRKNERESETTVRRVTEQERESEPSARASSAPSSRLSAPGAHSLIGTYAALSVSDVFKHSEGETAKAVDSTNEGTQSFHFAAAMASSHLAATA